MPANAANLRQVGQQRPAWSAKLTRHCIAQRRRGLSGRYRSKGTGTKASMGPPTGAAAPARKLGSKTHASCGAELALESAGYFGEALVGRSWAPSGSPDIGARRFGGLCYFGFWCRGLAELEPCARRIARAAVACPKASIGRKSADFLGK